MTSGKTFSILFEIFSKEELDDTGAGNKENSSMKNISQTDL